MRAFIQYITSCCMIKTVLLIIINVALLVILVYSWLLYNHRNAIVYCENPITNYSLLEVNCGSGYRGGSTILIEFNAKRYYVGLSARQCKSFNPQKIALFYDKRNDEVFVANELSVRIVVFYLILYLGSCILLAVCLIRRKWRCRNES